eukprot:6191198-Pleurochrysis_carterae.AAC.1
MMPTSCLSQAACKAWVASWPRFCMRNALASVDIQNANIQRKRRAYTARKTLAHATLQLFERLQPCIISRLRAEIAAEHAHASGVTACAAIAPKSASRSSGCFAR